MLYHNADDLLNPAILTPFSEQKFDLLGSKTDDASFQYESLGIYDQYDDSGPSSVHFGDGFEPSDHGETHISGSDSVLNGNVRLGELHAVSGMAEEHLSMTPSHEDDLHGAQLDGSHHTASDSILSPSVGLHGSRTITMAPLLPHDTTMLESITVRG